MISLKMLLVAATLSAGNAEFDRIAAKGAAEISLGRVRRELSTNGPVAGTLERAMLENPGRFRATDEAQAACRIIYAAKVEESYADRVRQLRGQLKLGDDFAPALSDEDRRRAMAGFEKRFADERAAACAAQAKSIAAVIRPAEAEFETTDEDSLRLAMCEKVATAQKTPVFEENLAFISEKIVDPLIDDARREMRRQREYLSRTRCEAYAPSALARELESNLRRNLEERRAKSKDPTREWGVFPATLAAALPPAVARRTLDRVSRCVDDVKIEVDAAAIARRMDREPKAHYRATESERRFRTEFATEVLDGALARAQAEAPAAERGEFAAYVKEHAADPELAKAVEARVRRDLLPALKAARAQISSDEMQSRWPTLTDGSWFPSADFADAVLARSDSSEAIGKWRDFGEMSELAKSGQTLLEETGKLADKSVAAAFDRARNALAAQNQLVDRAQPSVLADAKDRKNSFFSRTPDFAKVVQMLTAEVEKLWSENRERVLWPKGEVPANAAEQHAALFPSVKKRIELVARQILVEMEKPEPEDPPEENPEDPVDSEQPPEEPLMEFSIRVEKRDGEVKVQLLQGKSAVEDRTVGEKMSEFSEAMKAVSDRLGRDYLKLK